MKSKLVALAIICIFTSCSNDSPADLSADYIAAENVTYSNQVQAIISANCYSCHTDPPINGAPMRLTTYSDVRNAVLTRGLIDRISRAQGAEGMMPNGGQRLPESTINIIKKWQEEGLPE